MRVLYPDGSSVVQTAYVDMSVDVAIKAFARRLGALAGSGAGLYGGGPPEQPCYRCRAPARCSARRTASSSRRRPTSASSQHQRVPLLRLATEAGASQRLSEGSSGALSGALSEVAAGADDGDAAKTVQQLIGHPSWSSSRRR